MSDETPGKPDSPKGRKVRVSFRRNRSRPGRVKDWTKQASEAEGGDVEAHKIESVRAKGALSRKRTIIVSDAPSGELIRGVVLSILGGFNEVEADGRLWRCRLRRILKTRLIEARSPLAVGDRVLFRAAGGDESAPAEGLIEHVEPRTSELTRRVMNRFHTVAANVDRAVIVVSAGLPPPKPHLIDRYIVAALKGRIVPVVCLNKVDLDPEAADILERYRALGYAALATSAVRGDGIEALREVLIGRSSVIVGQSGVGKTALLNAIQPGLGLRVGELDRRWGKGRHTTTNARRIPLDGGGVIVDTPGVRTLDVTLIGKYELERFFEEFIQLVPNCRFPDCTHVHESDCAVRAAVERGEIHPDRYESYVRLFTDPAHEPVYD
ncbi:MAG: putative ribosome biogenesis GTPase RsgA [Phycisphaerae bacterium]|nr:putative ribosome biogenesis GTPase RsgA [Phycisphaerae bacterium]